MNRGAKDNKIGHYLLRTLKENSSIHLKCMAPEWIPGCVKFEFLWK